MEHRPFHRIVIVDGYATGRELTQQLLDRNVECLHLNSTAKPPPGVGYPFDPRPYDADLGFVGSTADAIELVATLAPDDVVAGSEWGVDLAEAIGSTLHLPRSSNNRPGVRWNRFDTLETLRRQGLLTANQSFVRSAQEAHAWARAHNQWPVIVKPADTIGSEQIELCHDHDDIAQACCRWLYRDLVPGRHSDGLLIQGYLPGPQYVVNTVGYMGWHHVTDAWQKEFVGGPDRPWAIRALHLLDPASPAVASAVGFTFEVLGALGLRCGAAHTEVRLTPCGPALIGTSPRLMGAAMDQPSYSEVDMITQAAAAATLLAGSEQERAHYLSAPHFAFQCHLSKVFFSFDRNGEIESTAGLDRLRTLPSFHAHYRPLKPGDRVGRHSGPHSCGGAVYLIHPKREQIREDIRQFIAWERAGLLYGLKGERAG